MWFSIYLSNEPDRACFQYDMAYGDFKNLTRITVSDKKFCNKIFNIAKNPKYDRYQWGLALMFYNFLIKELLVVVLKIKICQTSILRT